MPHDDLQKWKRAVIHLEGAADASTPEEQRAELEAESRARDEADQLGLAPPVLAPRPQKNIRAWGTAVYVRANGRRYLVTARHVLSPSDLAERDSESWYRAELARIDEWETVGYDDGTRLPPNGAKLLRERARETRDREREDWAFPSCFIVPNFDLHKAWGLPRDNLWPLHPGWNTAFSSELHDIAVIALENDPIASPWLARVPRELEAVGYAPIDISDIAETLPAEGAEVFTVGYPVDMAMMEERGLHPAEWHRASAHRSLPIFSFGRIAMTNEQLHFVLADMTIAPGNSGGPLVSDGKLVGIVVAQPTDAESNSIPFCYATKSSLALALLRNQVECDELDARRRSGEW